MGTRNHPQLIDGAPLAHLTESSSEEGLRKGGREKEREGDRRNKPFGRVFSSAWDMTFLIKEGCSFEATRKEPPGCGDTVSVFLLWLVGSGGKDLSFILLFPLTQLWHLR